MVRYDATEIFPIVDECGKVIGSATRKECHSGKMLLHPVVHLHVFDKSGRLYLQKRSMNKDIQPGKWDTSVGGHVDYGESVEAALRREASEELGLMLDSYKALFRYSFESEVERELVHSFMCVIVEDAIRFDSVEIEEGRFFKMAEIEHLVSAGLTTPNFALEFDRLRATLYTEQICDWNR